jgi:hypothetical protein
MLTEMRFQFVRREQNEIAHELAQLATKECNMFHE